MSSATVAGAGAGAAEPPTAAPPIVSCDDIAGDRVACEPDDALETATSSKRDVTAVDRQP